MERRSFLKEASIAGFLTTGGLMTNVFTQPNLKGLSNTSDPYHYKKSLDKTRNAPGLQIEFLATKEQTNGAYSLLLGRIRKGAEPAMHVHENEDEAFYLLDGEMIVTIGDKDYHAKPGDFIFLPRKIPHTQKLITDMLSTLLFISPAGLEQFFWDLSTPATSFDIPALATESPTEEQMKMMMEMNAKYGISPA